MRRLDIIRQNRLSEMHRQPPVYGLIAPPRSPGTSIKLTGGIGDIILGLGVCHALNRIVGDVTVYSNNPEVAKIFSYLPQKHVNDLDKNGLDWFITLNSITYFHFAKNFEGFKNKKVYDIFLNNSLFLNEKWKSLCANHPYSDNEMARYALKNGFNRETLAYAMLGLEYEKLCEPKLPYFENKYNWKYITIHNGFDETHSTNGYHTKVWPVEYWKQFVVDFKNRYPNIKIVQVGGKNSYSIKGVDSNMSGSIDMKNSLQIIKGGMFHVDNESGLVHAARAMNKKSVVMFGPTNMDFFGYKENVNIQKGYCKDCWWISDTWTAKCIEGYDKPECMYSITTDSVIFECDNLMKKYFHE